MLEVMVVVGGKVVVAAVIGCGDGSDVGSDRGMRSGRSRDHVVGSGSVERSAGDINYRRW